MNSKQLFKNTFKGLNTPRPPFVPFPYRVAAKITQISLEKMVHDPTYYYHGLSEAYKLLRYDGIINHFDATVEAESCGCKLEWHGVLAPPTLVEGCEVGAVEPEDFLQKGRFPILMEVTQNLVTALGKEVAIVAVVTGPCSLTRTLRNHAPGIFSNGSGDAVVLVGNLLAKLVKALCELKIDAVFIREDILGEEFQVELAVFEDSYKSVYTTLCNIIRFFNTFSALVTKDMDLELLGDLSQTLRLNGLIPFGYQCTEEGLKNLKNFSDSRRLCIGLPLPIGIGDPSELQSQLALINGFMLKHGPKGFFYTSDGEIPPDVPMEIIHDVIAHTIA